MRLLKRLGGYLGYSAMRARIRHLFHENGNTPLPWLPPPLPPYLLCHTDAKWESDLAAVLPTRPPGDKIIPSP